MIRVERYLTAEIRREIFVDTEINGIFLFFGNAVTIALIRNIDTILA